MAEKRLVVDASVLVGDLLRTKGLARLRDRRLELFLPEQMANETGRELPRRVAAIVRHRELTEAEGRAVVDGAFDVLRTSLMTTREAVYIAAEGEARARCLRDPTDWPVVASALVLGAEIWTNDNDFLGVGVATWTTDTLQGWLDRN